MLAACGPTLPESDAPGAVVYSQRCGGCHRLYAPGTMTLDMWKVQLGRMRELFARRGVPWPAPAEEQAMVEWLGKHAGRS